MQSISVVLSALISCEQYRLKCAPKVAKTDRPRNSVISKFQTVGLWPCHRESPTAECNCYFVVSGFRRWLQLMHLLPLIHSPLQCCWVPHQDSMAGIRPSPMLTHHQKLKLRHFLKLHPKVFFLNLITFDCFIGMLDIFNQSFNCIWMTWRI